MAQVERFRALHAEGCFLLPNPWDVGSAVLLEHLGFEALATSSSAFAFTRGLPDHPDALSIGDVLAHVRDVVQAVDLPVNVDFQHGYAVEHRDHRDLDALATNVTACVATGCAGLSIEDATGDRRQPLFGDDEALDRVRAARAAIDATGTGVLLTARCEAMLLGVDDAERIAFERLSAFVEAGADCVYAPGITDTGLIERLVDAMAPCPVNVLVSGPVTGFTTDALAAAGARRISVGSALARTAWGAFLRTAAHLRETGRFEVLGEAASFAELDDVFGARIPGAGGQD